MAEISWRIRQRESEDGTIAGPAEAEAKVDVLIIRTQQGVESADPADGLGAVEGTRAAGGEDVFERAFRPIGGGLAVAALGGPAGQRVGIAGGIDAARVGADQDQGRNRADGRVGKRRQAGFEPARGDLGVVVQKLDELPVRGAQAGVGGGTEPAVSWAGAPAGPGDNASLPS